MPKNSLKLVGNYVQIFQKIFVQRADQKKGRLIWVRPKKGPTNVVPKFFSNIILKCTSFDYFDTDDEDAVIPVNVLE